MRTISIILIFLFQGCLLGSSSLKREIRNSVDKVVISHVFVHVDSTSKPRYFEIELEDSLSFQILTENIVTKSRESHFCGSDGRVYLYHNDTLLIDMGYNLDCKSMKTRYRKKGYMFEMTKEVKELLERCRDEIGGKIGRELTTEF